MLWELRGFLTLFIILNCYVNSLFESFASKHGTGTSPLPSQYSSSTFLVSTSSSLECHLLDYIQYYKSIYHNITSPEIICFLSLFESNIWCLMNKRRGGADVEGDWNKTMMDMYHHQVLSLWKLWLKCWPWWYLGHERSLKKKKT